MITIRGWIFNIDIYRINLLKSSLKTNWPETLKLELKHPPAVTIHICSKHDPLCISVQISLLKEGKGIFSKSFRKVCNQICWTLPKSQVVQLYVSSNMMHSWRKIGLQSHRFFFSFCAKITKSSVLNCQDIFIVILKCWFDSGGYCCCSGERCGPWPPVNVKND